MAANRPCRHCGDPVAANVKRCPQCGGKSPYPIRRREMVAAGVIIVFAVLALAMCDPRARPRPAPAAPAAEQP